MANSDIDNAHAVLRRDYYDDVRGLAESVRRWWDDDPDATRDDLIEHLDESVDGHARVIYTGQAIECLRYSDHEDAYLDEMGELPSAADGMPWSQLACFAFRCDVIERLEADGLDVNDPTHECSVDEAQR